MNNQKTNYKIDWEMLLKLPLDTKLAKKATSRISDHTAHNQIASALHESVHIFYALKHNSPIFSVLVATSPSFKNLLGNNVKGEVIDLLDNWTIGAIESYLAACLFELELDFDNENKIAKIEQSNAINSVQMYRKVNADNVSLPFFSDKNFLEGIFEKIYPHEFTKNWITIKTVAKALLYYRDKIGYLPQGYIRSLTDYVRECLSEMRPSHGDAEDFYSTMRDLSPFVKKQNVIEKKQYDKWMRENDIDTILNNHKIKKLQFKH